MLPKSGAERLIARIVYTGPVPAPVTEGTPIGNIKVWRNDSLILTMPLKAAESDRQRKHAAARFRCCD